MIKGAVAGPGVELCFAGGKLGELRAFVPGVVTPRLGERGIYVVASVSRPHLNPLYGWDQGHFLIEPQETGGAPVVKTARRRPVTGIESGLAGAPGRSAGIARGVRVAESARGRGRGLAPDAFKARLRALLWARP